MLRPFLSRAIILVALATVPSIGLAASGTPLQVVGSGSESSSGAGSVLQPSSPQTLQASGDSGSSVGGQSTADNQASSSSSLQATPNSQAVNNYLNGELTGGPQGSKPTSPMSNNPVLFNSLATAILLLVLATVVILYVRRNRKESRTAFTSQIPESAKANGKMPSPELAEAIEEAVILDETNLEPVVSVPKTGVKGAGVSAKKSHGSAKKKAKKARKH